MNYHEFLSRLPAKTEVSNADYELIEVVYTWHPAIDNIKGKDQIAKLYKDFGVVLGTDYVLGWGDVTPYFGLDLTPKL